jgi:hypothetical protein
MVFAMFQYPDPDKERVLELWCDSYKEGEWFLDNLKQLITGHKTVYAHGFQPVTTFSQDSDDEFTAVVYGEYRSWENVPKKLVELLEYGKPDIILYDPKEEEILLALEETAAVPTGNQSMQRLERVWYSAHARIPFVYLISEFGRHKDGGLRRTSIWPAYLSLKLSCQYKIPSLVLLYGSHEDPEDYSVGDGVDLLTRFGHSQILQWLGHDTTESKRKLLKNAFASMGKFIQCQYLEISEKLPGVNMLENEDFLDFVVGRAIVASR